MRKEVKQETTRTIHVCDLCEKPVGSQDTCWFCRLDCCYRCSKHMFFAREDQLLEFIIRVCNRCQEHTDLAEKVQAILDGANRELREWVEIWKKAVDERKAP